MPRIVSALRSGFRAERRAPARAPVAAEAKQRYSWCSASIGSSAAARSRRQEPEEEADHRARRRARRRARSTADAHASSRACASSARPRPKAEGDPGDAAEQREQTASIRNCTRMSRRRAPIAMRTPISRVRSATLTSMMFITPIAADEERDAGDREQETAQDARRSLPGSYGTPPGCGPGSRVVALVDAVALAQDARDLALGLGHVRRALGARDQSCTRRPSVGATRARKLPIGISTRSSWSSKRRVALGLRACR